MKNKIQDQAKDTTKNTTMTQKKAKSQNSKTLKKPQTMNSYTKKEHPRQTQTKQEGTLPQLDQHH